MHHWVLLATAVLVEVAGTSMLKLSDGFSRLGPTVGTLVLYALSFYLLALVLRSLDVGVAYAIWSGLGTALVVLAGVIFFGEELTAARAASVALIILGIVGLQWTQPA
jgi:small multidrug resistance pump